MKENTKNPGSQNQGAGKTNWDDQSDSRSASRQHNNDKTEREKTSKTGLNSDSRIETTSAQSPNRKTMDQDENLKPHTTGKEKRENDLPRSNEKNDQGKSNRSGNSDSGRGSAGR